LLRPLNAEREEARVNDFNAVRAKIGGLKGVMQKMGDAPPFDHKWKSMPACPFCGAKEKAGVFHKGDTDFFKCHAPGCSSGNECMAEVGYIAARKGLSMDKPATGGPSPAYKFFLELAGCYEEPKQKPQAPNPRPTDLDDEQIILKSIEIISRERKVSVLLLKQWLQLGQSNAERIIGELEKRGVIGPAKASKPREILIPEKPEPPEREAPEREEPVLPNPVLPSEVTPPPIPLEDRPTLPSEPAPEAGKKDASDGPAGRIVLEDFYSQLSLSREDAGMLRVKRGLFDDTCRRLGFVSSPVENKDKLLGLQEKHAADELLESGLFLPEDKKRKKEFRPNSQFYGMGQKAKKPKEDRKHKDDRWVWGMTHPVLIPYFDEAGRLLKLRPHKGGAPGNTLSGATRIYVPRDYKLAADVVETFPAAVITEGEFKAAALWQVLGGGRDDIEDIGYPWGVCAVPGINFGNNYDLRAGLDEWLQSVQCRQVVVAFDDQDKSGRPMRERHEALIWARFLACDLARTLHIKAKVLVLATEWRDDNGKADWDGALAMMLAGKIKV